MNKHTDPWETEMSREFDQRVRDLHEAPLTLDRVKGKAGRIRRTRRLVAAGGALAAAAVIVPIVVFAGGNLTDDSGPDPAPKPTPNPTVIDPTGTGFDYLEGRTLHRADGTTLDLPELYQDGSVMGDLFAGVRYDDEGRPFLDIVDDSGEVVETHETVTGIAATDDGSTIAYVDPDGVLWTQSDNGRISIHDGLPQTSRPQRCCAARRHLDRAVWVNYGDGTTPPENVSSHFRLTEAPDALSVGDATSRLVAVMNESLDEGSCGGGVEWPSSSTCGRAASRTCTTSRPTTRTSPAPTPTWTVPAPARSRSSTQRPATRLPASTRRTATSAGQCGRTPATCSSRPSSPRGGVSTDSGSTGRRSGSSARRQATSSPRRTPCSAATERSAQLDGGQHRLDQLRPAGPRPPQMDELDRHDPASWMRPKSSWKSPTTSPATWNAGCPAIVVGGSTEPLA